MTDALLLLYDALNDPLRNSAGAKVKPYRACGSFRLLGCFGPLGCRIYLKVLKWQEPGYLCTGKVCEEITNGNELYSLVAEFISHQKCTLFVL